MTAVEEKIKELNQKVMEPIKAEFNFIDPIEGLEDLYMENHSWIETNEHTDDWKRSKIQHDLIVFRALLERQKEMKRIIVELSTMVKS